MNHPSHRFDLRALQGALCALLACATLAGVPARALAEQADRDKPLNFQADNLAYDDLRQVNVLTGNVVLTKGTILIRADRVEVRQDPQGYQYATGTVTGATPAYFRQKRDGIDEYVEGTARRLDYDGKNDITTLTTQAVVKRLSGLSTVLDEVHGSVIRYDGQRDFYTATSGRDVAGPGNPSGRVSGTLAPRVGPATPGATVGAKPTATATPATSATAPATPSAATPAPAPDATRSGAQP